MKKSQNTSQYRNLRQATALSLMAYAKHQLSPSAPSWERSAVLPSEADGRIAPAAGWLCHPAVRQHGAAPLANTYVAGAGAVAPCAARPSLDRPQAILLYAGYVRPVFAVMKMPCLVQVQP